MFLWDKVQLQLSCTPYQSEPHMEDVNLSPAERTRRVIHGTMQEIQNFLKFTMETSEDFESGLLATLDTDLCVTEGNKIDYRCHEKSVSSNVYVQKLTAMEENSRGLTRYLAFFFFGRRQCPQRRRPGSP